MSKMREIMHFKHQIMIIEHLFQNKAIYLQQKKILMVKVYG